MEWNGRFTSFGICPYFCAVYCAYDINQPFLRDLTDELDNSHPRLS